MGKIVLQITADGLNLYQKVHHRDRVRCHLQSLPHHILGRREATSTLLGKNGLVMGNNCFLNVEGFT